MSAMFEDIMTGLDEVDVFLAGKKVGYKVTLPEDVDVKSIRKRLNMTQARFSDIFGFSLDAVKRWEGGRRTPEPSARAFLTVIAKKTDCGHIGIAPRTNNGCAEEFHTFHERGEKDAATDEDSSRSQDRGAEHFFAPTFNLIWILANTYARRAL